LATKLVTFPGQSNTSPVPLLPFAMQLVTRFPPAMPPTVKPRPPFPFEVLPLIVPKLP